MVIDSRCRGRHLAWRRIFGFELTFDSSWFNLLVGENSSASIAFMTPDHPSAPPGSDMFNGTGMCFELEVDEARPAHDELTAKGLTGDYPLTNEPSDQRRFGFVDPAGLWVDVIEQIAPQAGFWDRYLV